jgi:hypothetical protein
MRHHVKRGIVNPDCTFCVAPNVKALKEQSVLREQPVPAAETVPPATVVAAPAGGHEDDLVQAEVDRSLFRDRCWACAQSGMSLDEAARTLDMQLQLFVPMVNAEFNGKTWTDLREQARLSVRRDLTCAAIRESQSGNTRLLAKLLDEGFFSGLLVDEKANSEALKKPLSEDQMIEFLISRLSPVGMLRWQERMNQRGSTITMRDATPEELESVTNPGGSASSYSRTLDYDGKTITTPEPKQSSEVNDKTVNEVKQLPSAPAPEPAQLVESVVQEALGPVVATPASGLPLYSEGSDRRLS